MSYPVLPPPAPVATPAPAGRPPVVSVAAVLLWVMAAAGLIYAIATLAVVPGTVDRFRSGSAFRRFGNEDDPEAFIAVVWLGAAVALALAVILFALYIVLGIALRRGSNAARIATLVVCGVGALAGIGTIATVVVERSGDAVPRSLGSLLTTAYPSGWIGLNITLAILQVLGYALVGVLVLAAPRAFFRRGGGGEPVPAGAPPHGPPYGPQYGLPYPGGSPAVAGHPATGYAPTSVPPAHSVYTPGSAPPGGYMQASGPPAPGGYGPPPQAGYEPSVPGGYGPPAPGGYGLPPQGGHGSSVPGGYGPASAPPAPGAAGPGGTTGQGPVFTPPPNAGGYAVWSTSSVPLPDQAYMPPPGYGAASPAPPPGRAETVAPAQEGRATSPTGGGVTEITTQPPTVQDGEFAGPGDGTPNPAGVADGAASGSSPSEFGGPPSGSDRGDGSTTGVSVAGDSVGGGSAESGAGDGGTGGKADGRTVAERVGDDSGVRVREGGATRSDDE